MADCRWLDVDGDWTNTSNWSNGSAPTDGDDVYIETGSKTINTNLGQSAVKVASLNIAKNFTGKIGTASTKLDIGADQVNIGYSIGNSSPSGSQWIYLDIANTTACDIRVSGSASSSDDPRYGPIIIEANDADIDLTVSGGTVSLNPIPGTTGVVGDISVTGGNLYIGHRAQAANTTITNITCSGGFTQLIGDVSGTVNANGGTISVLDDSDLATLSMRGNGVVDWRSNETLNSLTFIDGGTFDASNWAGAFTITTLTMKVGATVKYNPNLVTITNWTDPEAQVVTLSIA